jgi:hypothetical protein
VRRAKMTCGHYHYQAYGVPQIALWIEATAGPVVSPYSHSSRSGVDSVAASPQPAPHGFFRMGWRLWLL